MFYYTFDVSCKKSCVNKLTMVTCEHLKTSYIYLKMVHYLKIQSKEPKVIY